MSQLWIIHDYMYAHGEYHDNADNYLAFIAAERTEESSKALQTKRELQTRVEQISKDFEEEKKLTLDITKDMTRQYKGLQEELMGRVSVTFGSIVSTKPYFQCCRSLDS